MATDRDAAPRVGDTPAGGRAWVLVLVYFGIAFTEVVNLQVLPLTVSRFTGDALLIGLILAINPCFGFLVQPVVGYWSDRIGWRIGRRATFLVLAAPAVALGLVLLPRAETFGQLVAAILLLQFAHDVMWGAEQPLLGDLIPAKARVRVAGCIMVAGQLAVLAIVAWGLPAVEQHERAAAGGAFGQPVYWAAAAVTIGCVFIPAFWLGESARPAAAAPFSWRSYADAVLGHPMLRKIALMKFLHAVQLGALGGFLILFATETLRIGKAEYGRAAAMLPVLSIAVAIAGTMVFKAGLQPRWLGGAAALAFVAAVTGYFSTDVTGLIAAQAMLATGGIVVMVILKAGMMDFIPRERLGQVTTSLNIFHGAGRAVGMVLVGWGVGLAGGDYRLLWPMLLVVAAAKFAVAARMQRELAGGRAGPESGGGVARSPSGPARTVAAWY